MSPCAVYCQRVNGSILVVKLKNSEVSIHPYKRYFSPIVSEVTDSYLKSCECFSLTSAAEILLVLKVLIVKTSILYRDYYIFFVLRIVSNPVVTSSVARYSIYAYSFVIFST